MRARSTVATSVMGLVLARPSHAEAEAPTPGTATTLSVVGAAVPTGLIAYGLLKPDDAEAIAIGAVALMVTPSLGHWYAGDFGSTGARIRGAGIASVGLGGLIGAIAVAACFEAGDCRPAEHVGRGLVLAGAGTIAIGAIVDVVTAGRAARARRDHRPGLQVTPGLGPGGGSLAVGGAF